MVRQISLIIASWLLSMSLTSAQTQPGQQLSGRGPADGRGRADITTLLAMSEVQKELGVRDQQKGKIDELLTEFRDAGRAGGGGRGLNRPDLQNLSPEERRKRLRELREEGEQRAKKAEVKAKEILDSAQFDRLTQLRLQREGPMALAREEVARKLHLSEKQQEEIRTIRDQARSVRGSRAEGDRQKAIAETRQRREKANSEILALLSPKQQETWKQMQGEKFDFPTPQGPGDSTKL